MTNRLSYADLDRMERKKCKDPFFFDRQRQIELINS